MNAYTMRALCICLMALMLTPCSRTARADIPATQPQPSVAVLVHDLSDDSFAQRNQAEQKLIAMGDDIEGQLRGALANNVPEETRQRLLRILQGFADDRRFGPTKITLHYHDQPLLTVLEDFARQASADMGVHDRDLINYVGKRRVSIDLDHVSFWTALANLEKIGDLGTSFDRVHPTKFIFTPNPRHFADILLDRGCESGPFFVYPCYATLSTDFARGTTSAEVAVSIVAEPKIDVLELDTAHWGQQCQDESGLAIPLTDAIGAGPIQWTNYFHVLRTELQEVHGMGHRIAQLKGRVIATVADTTDSFVVDDLSKLDNLSKTIAGETVTLSSVTAKDGQFHIHVMLAGSDWGLGRTMESGIQLLDAMDQPLQVGPQGPIEIRAGSRQTGTNLSFIPRDATNIPAKLRWEFPARMRRMVVPFDLQHMELPHLPLASATSVTAATSPTTQPALVPSSTPIDPEVAGLLRSSSITMHYHNAPLMQVLGDFQKQCSTDLGLDRPEFNVAATMRISVDLDHADYWKAMDVLSDAAWDNHGFEGVPLRGFWPSKTEQSAYEKVCGPCCIVAKGVGCRIQYAPGQGDEPSSLNLSASVHFEPKLQVMTTDALHWARQIVDENGASISTSSIYSPCLDMSSASLNAELRQFPGMGGKIARLTGELGVEVATGPFDVVQIADPASLNELVKPVGNLTVTLHHLTETSHVFTLALTVSGNIGDDWRGTRDRLFTRLEFLSPGNHPFPPGFNQWHKPTFVSQTRVDAMVSAMSMIRPAGLRWEIPTKTKRLIIPIELDDVPLPGPP